MVKKLKDITCYESSEICSKNYCYDNCPLKMYVTDDGKVVNEEDDNTRALCIHDDLDELFECGLANYEVDIPEDCMYHDDSSEVKTETTTEVKYNSEGGITW